MSDIVISVENLSKRYRLGEIRSSHTLAETLSERFQKRFRPHAMRSLSDADQARTRDEEILWALKDISFTVERGEVLGIIGRNGAGKSTLLKIMSRITEPTSGRMEIRGRVGSLLEVGTGFHPELTGRENVYLNGAILGMSREDIARKFDEIVEFSEIAKFIDTPVKRYSSGMYTRLAFAVAAHLDPPILIVDEVLSVGDAAFQKKCLGKINNMTRSGRTVVFVSHNMGAIAELCTKAVFIHKGEVRGVGTTARMIEQYVQMLGATTQGGKIAVDETAPFSFISANVMTRDGKPSEMFDIQDEVLITMTYKVRQHIEGLQIAAIVARNMAEIIYAIDTDDVQTGTLAQPGTYRAVYRLPSMLLKGGSYSVRLAAGTQSTIMQELSFALNFEVDDLSINTYSKSYRRERPGVIVSPGVWNSEKVDF